MLNVVVGNFDGGTLLVGRHAGGEAGDVAVARFVWFYLTLNVRVEVLQHVLTGSRVLREFYAAVKFRQLQRVDLQWIDLLMHFHGHCLHLHD